MHDSNGHHWWAELMTRDTDRAKAFYGATLGWSFEAMDMSGGTYWVGMCQGRPAGGIMNMTGLPGMEGVPDHWFSYFAIADLDAALTMAVAQGGTVLRPPFEVPNVGRIAILQDATGAAVGLMTPSVFDG